LLNKCWEHEQNKRPSFEEIFDELNENEKEFKFDEVTKENFQINETDTIKNDNILIN
jgi:hypothetical protein